MNSGSSVSVASCLRNCTDACYLWHGCSLVPRLPLTAGDIKTKGKPSWEQGYIMLALHVLVG